MHPCVWCPDDEDEVEVLNRAEGANVTAESYRAIGLARLKLADDVPPGGDRVARTSTSFAWIHTAETQPVGGGGGGSGSSTADIDGLGCPQVELIEPPRGLPALRVTRQQFHYFEVTANATDGEAWRIDEHCLAVGLATKRFPSNGENTHRHRCYYQTHLAHSVLLLH